MPTLDRALDGVRPEQHVAIRIATLFACVRLHAVAQGRGVGRDNDQVGRKM